MTISEFHDFHMPALLADEIRHNLMIAVLADAKEGRIGDIETWTLGKAGACAIRVSGRAVILGNLTRAQCQGLAEDMAETDFPAVLGSDLTASWFVERSEELGLAFEDPIPQQICALSTPPVFPDTPGHARSVGEQETDRFVDWITAFHHEAVPHDPVPPRSTMEKWIGEDRYLFWIVEEEPVSMACIQRRTPNAAAIAAVYTPPERRGRGYAGCVTASVVNAIHAEGRKMACLYTDLRNPHSNRCYARVGFRPVCNSQFFLRREKAP